jgi:hypothetical protein
MHFRTENQDNTQDDKEGKFEVISCCIEHKSDVKNVEKTEEDENYDDEDFD